MIADRLAEHVKNCAADKLADHLSQVRHCVELLTDEQIGYRPNQSSNSIGNLLLHLRGNVTQWIIGGIGGQPFERDRAAEFGARAPLDKPALIEPLSATIAEGRRILRGLDADALVREYPIQEYRVTGLAAVLHVVEHFAFHTGQIVTITKWLLDVDLSLYDAQGHRRDLRRGGAP